jgi:hypothetical protein
MDVESVGNNPSASACEDGRSSEPDSQSNWPLTYESVHFCIIVAFAVDKREGKEIR